MSSRIDKRPFRTAAWRISLWGALTFAVGTALAFLFLRGFLATDLQKRTDAWLVGELGVLADVAKRTPDSELHDVIIREVAELASQEAPSEVENIDRNDHAVFFLLTDRQGRPLLHTGSGAPDALTESIRSGPLSPRKPVDISLPGIKVPFRTVQMEIPKEEHIYLGFSKHYERGVLKRLDAEFITLWCVTILLGGAIVFTTTYRMLQRVQAVSDAAAQIGKNNLATRVLVSKKNDEISQLSITLNNMLDRVQATVQQLHTMTDAIAHDIRSPITAIRGRLELALIDSNDSPKEELIASTIEQLDRLTTMLTMSLDVSEANANALRLHKQQVDLGELINSLYNLYEPVFNEAGISFRLEVSSPAIILGDLSLLERAITNLFDNEIKHLPAGSTGTISVLRTDVSFILQIQDDGPGFAKELLPTVLEPYVRSKGSAGHGLGLAFVAAAIRSQGGDITVANRDVAGALIEVIFPAHAEATALQDALIL